MRKTFSSSRFTSQLRSRTGIYDLYTHSLSSHAYRKVFREKNFFSLPCYNVDFASLSWMALITFHLIANFLASKLFSFPFENYFYFALSLVSVCRAECKADILSVFLHSFSVLLAASRISFRFTFHSSWVEAGELFLLSSGSAERLHGASNFLIDKKSLWRRNDCRNCFHQLDQKLLASL